MKAEGGDWEFERLEGCPLCGSADVAPRVRKTVRGIRLSFDRCLRCGLVYQNPRFTAPTAAAYFSSTTFVHDAQAEAGGLEALLGYDDYFAWEGGYRKNARMRLREIVASTPPPARLLEIGSASGVFLDEARRLGYEVRGLDLSAVFAAEARKNYALEIDVGAIETFTLPSGAYDIVCCWGGIPCWRDFAQGLANVRRCLKPDGAFFLNHTDGDSLLARLLGARYFEFNHSVFTVFTNPTMDRALSQAGFTTLLRRVDRQYAAIGWILTYLKTTLGLRWAQRFGLSKLVVPVLALSSVYRHCRAATTGVVG